MVRFLFYANEWGIEGLIQQFKRFHWLGNSSSGGEWINAQIDQYARIYPHLRENADGYPSESRSACVCVRAVEWRYSRLVDLCCRFQTKARD